MAYDTFVGLAADTSIQGSTFDNGALTWLTPTKMLSDGANSVKFDSALAADAVAGNFAHPANTIGVAMFFTLTADLPSGSRAGAIEMQGTGSAGSQYNQGGVAVRIGGLNNVSQVLYYTDTTKLASVVMPTLTAGQQYCAEVVKSGARTYTAKLYAASNNVRGAVLATTPSITLDADPASTNLLSQVVKGTASVNTLIQRVETLAPTPVTFSGPVPTRNGSVGSAASFANAGFFAGSATPFTYSLQAGVLPAGLTLSASTGIISGAPTTADTQSGIVVRATDANGATADTNAYSIVIAASNAAPTFPGTIANISGTSGAAITPVNVSGQFSDTDTLAYSASPAGTAWPSGLTIDSATGVISGTVASSTTTGLKVRATDTASQTVDSNTFSVTISAPAATTGSFKTKPLANNTGTLYAAGTAVSWEWHQARVGTSGSVTYGSGQVAADGTLTATGVPVGAGFLLAAILGAALANDKPYYQPGTAA